MTSSRLRIDTKVAPYAGPSSGKLSPRDTRKRSPLPSLRATSNDKRLRSASNASTSSSVSVISPKSSSTNASTTSLHIPTRGRNALSRSASPSSPLFEETVRPGPEYVLAMHDYSPQTQNATCLSFRAGQVIHVLNRDTSGWWDGELEGRRGWFPSNYVNAEVPSLTEEQFSLEQSASFPFMF